MPHAFSSRHFIARLLFRRHYCRHFAGWFLGHGASSFRRHYCLMAEDGCLLPFMFAAEMPELALRIATRH